MTRCTHFGELTPFERAGPDLMSQGGFWACRNRYLKLDRRLFLRSMTLYVVGIVIIIYVFGVYCNRILRSQRYPTLGLDAKIWPLPTVMLVIFALLAGWMTAFILWANYLNHLEGTAPYRTKRNKSGAASRSRLTLLIVLPLLLPTTLAVFVSIIPSPTFHTFIQTLPFPILTFGIDLYSVVTFAWWTVIFSMQLRSRK